MANPEKILILTPVKNGARHLDTYFRLLQQLSYPKEQLSLGILESDSDDGSHEALKQRLSELRPTWRAANLWKKDFGYRLPPRQHRADGPIQLMRRSILARSRNHLLHNALAGEDWVLWLDVDVIDYPADVIERMLATGKSIVHPHCVLDYGGPSFDRNAWVERGARHLDDLRTEGELVPLHAVGGTMLLIRADIHRDGLIFPPFTYGEGHKLARPGRGEIETEGLGLMAYDMGHRCWGMPNLEIRHARE